MSADDPLLQPFTIKHLTLRNRLMTTAHEPAYAEDGLPKKSDYRRFKIKTVDGNDDFAVVEVYERSFKAMPNGLACLSFAATNTSPPS